MIPELTITAVTPEAILKAEPLGYQVTVAGIQGPSAPDFIDDSIVATDRLWSSQKTSDEIADSTSFVAEAIAAATAPLVTTQSLTDALLLKASLASPAFTGTPTAPTAASNDNSGKLATTGFVATAVAAAITALVNLAPSALDTLGELAAQMQTDETGVAALTTVVGTKAPLAGAAFTGAISAPSLSLSGALAAASSTLTGQLSAQGATFYDPTAATGDTIVSLRDGAAGAARLRFGAGGTYDVALSHSATGRLQINTGTLDALADLQLSTLYFKSGSGVQGAIRGDIVSFQKFDGTQTLKFDYSGASPAISLYNSATFVYDVNNVFTWTQKNAAGNAFLPGPYYNSENRLYHSLTAGVAYVGPASGSGGTYPFTHTVFQATSMPIGTGNNSFTTLLGGLGPAVNFTTNSATAGPTASGRVEAFNLGLSAIGGDLIFVLYNQDNTYGYGNTSFTGSNAGTLASASSNCGLRLLGRQFGGDLYVRFDNQATQTWQMGLDNNDGGKFKVASSAALGSSDRLAIWKDGSLEHNVVWAASNTFTGTTAIGSTQITGTSFVGSIRVGDTITGTGIPASTIVSGITADGLVNITNAATAAGTATFTVDHSTATLRAFRINVTDSGSAAISSIVDFQVGGVSKFSINKAGVVTAASTITTTGSVVSASGSGPVLLADGSGNPVARWGTSSASNALIKRIGTQLQVRLGDDSGDADFKLRDLTLRPSAALTPANNGDLAIQATSNTSLTFKLKGSDGTVRSGSLTLA